MSGATRAELARRFGACAIVIVVAALVHFGFARFMAAHDPVSTVAGRPEAAVLVGAIGLVMARLFLLFFAPAWVLYLLGTAVVATLSRRGPR